MFITSSFFIFYVNNKYSGIKIQKKCFVPCDSAYYCLFIITGKAKFDENKILDFIVRDSGVDFHIYDDLINPKKKSLLFIWEMNFYK